MTVSITWMRRVEADDSEKEYEISGTVSPFIRGRYTGPPDQCFPDEGGEVEVTSIKLAGGDGAELVDTIDFTIDEWADIEDRLATAADDEADDEDPPDPPDDLD